MQVSDVMTPRGDLVTATVPGSREDVLRVLQDRAFSSVPVIKESEDGEVFRGLVSRERLIEEPDEEQLALLLEEIEPIEPTTDLVALAQHMVRTGARRVPVVDGGLDGIVTITDVVHALANGELAVEDEVGQYAASRINTVFVEATLPAAERCLYYSEEPYAVVLDDEGDITGMLTEVDIVEVAEVVQGSEGWGDSIANEDSEWAWEGIKAIGNRILPTRNVEFPDEHVRAVMSEDVITISGTRSVKEAAQLLIGNDIEQLPVMQGDQLVGIVKDMNLLNAINE